MDWIQADIPFSRNQHGGHIEYGRVSRLQPSVTPGSRFKQVVNVGIGSKDIHAEVIRYVNLDTRIVFRDFVDIDLQMNQQLQYRQ